MGAIPGPQQKVRLPAQSPALGDAARFAELAMPHLDAAYNLARWLARDATLADDIVQDAMLRAITYFGSFRGENPRAWLLQIVRNVAYDTMRLRRAASELETPLDHGADDAEDRGGVPELPDPGRDPETALASRQDLQGFEQALAALPAELRECLVLRELEEFSYKDIARITGVPIGTVMSRLWRARRLLLKACRENEA